MKWFIIIKYQSHADALPRACFREGHSMHFFATPAAGIASNVLPLWQICS